MNFPPHRDSVLVIPSARALCGLLRELGDVSIAFSDDEWPAGVRLELAGCYAVSYSELKEANVTMA